MLQPAVALAAFNLVCTGTLESRDIAGDSREPYRTEYRINLEQNKWCSGECRRLFEIHSVHPTQLTLQETATDTAREQRNFSDRVDRQTGAHTILMTSRSRATGPMIMKWEGQCERAPFSGFPTFETRF